MSGLYEDLCGEAPCGKHENYDSENRKESGCEHGSEIDRCAIHSGQASMDWTFPSSEMCGAVLTGTSLCFIKDKGKRHKYDLLKGLPAHLALYRATN